MSGKVTERPRGSHTTSKKTEGGNPFVVAFSRWVERGGTSQAAALTFYSLFAIGPVLTLSLALAADVLGNARAHADFEAFLNSFVSPEAASSLVSLLERQENVSLASAFTVNGLLLLISAGAFMRQLRKSMSGPALLDLSEKKQLVRRALFNRLIALGLVFTSVGALALLTLGTALLSAGVALLESRARFFSWALPAFDITATLLVASLCFFTLYRFIPKKKPDSRSALLASVLIAVTFIGGKSLLALYLSRAPLNTTYGAAGSLVVTLLWLFFVCNLMLLGNEFAQQLSQRRT